MAIINQISTILNDVIEDMTGQSAAIQDIDTTDIVSMGKSIANMDLTENFFGKLVNRIAKTVYFIRVYNPRRGRSILRDEHEYGAFIQKVYYTAPDIADNPEQSVATWNAGSVSYAQHSPYSVTAVVAVDAKIFGGQGTFSLEIVRPVDQIRTAFLSYAEMMRFIDGIYLAIENKFKLAEEGLLSSAICTAMACDINGGKVRNLLTEYNTNIAATPITDEEVAMTDPDFLKYMAKEISQTVNYMQDMSTAFNVNGYLTFTDKKNLMVELLAEAEASLNSYLYSDTFHKQLIELDGYEVVNKWQFTGQAGGSFANNSSIDIVHDEFKSATNLTGEISQDGIVAFVYDIEHVAAYFGHRRSWEIFNPRDDVYVHGETARKGYAVDPNANGVVFVVKYVAP